MRILSVVAATALSGLLFISPARSQETGGERSAGFRSIAVGGSYALPLAGNYQTFSPKFGGTATIRYAQPDLLGDHMNFIGTVSFRTYGVRGLSNSRILQIPFLVGVEAAPSGVDFIARPYAGIQIGGIYSSFTLTDASNLAQNAAVSFMTRVLTGVQVPVFDQFSITGESAFDFIASSNQFFALTGIVSLRYGL